MRSSPGGVLAAHGRPRGAASSGAAACRGGGHASAAPAGPPRAHAHPPALPLPPACHSVFKGLSVEGFCKPSIQRCFNTLKICGYPCLHIQACLAVQVFKVNTQQSKVGGYAEGEADLQRHLRVSQVLGIDRQPHPPFTPAVGTTHPACMSITRPTMDHECHSSTRADTTRPLNEHTHTESSVMATYYKSFVVAALIARDKGRAGIVTKQLADSVTGFLIALLLLVQRHSCGRHGHIHPGSGEAQEEGATMLSARACDLRLPRLCWL